MAWYLSTTSVLDDTTFVVGKAVPRSVETNIYDACGKSDSHSLSILLWENKAIIADSNFTLRTVVLASRTSEAVVERVIITSLLRVGCKVFEGTLSVTTIAAFLAALFVT